MQGPVQMPGGALVSPQTVLLWAAFALLAAGGASLAVRWYRTPRGPIPWPRVAVYGALFVLALALRLFVSPHTVMTENAHGYELLRSAFRLDGYPYHGQAYYAFFYLVAAVCGRHPEVVFCGNALLGATAVVLLVPLGRRVTASETAGWMAALAYACWPAVLRIAASETMFPLGICCALLAWLAWLRAWETGEPLQFALAAAATAVTVQTRPELAPWPLVLLLSLPLASGWTRLLRRPGPWVGLVVFALLSCAWVAFRLRVQTSSGVPEFMSLGPRSFFGALLSDRNLLLRGEWTSTATQLLAVAGVVWLALARWRALPALVGGFLVMAWMVMPVGMMDVNRLRLQSVVHPLFLLAAGAGVAAVVPRLAGRRRTVALALLGATLLVTSALRFHHVRERFDPQREYAFLARAVPALPAGCAIVVADRSMARNRIITEFPVWWARGPVERADRYLRRPAVLDSHPCRFFYRGLSCYQFTGGEPKPPAPDVLRPECRALERSHRLVSHVETTFPARPYGDTVVPAREITLGFYRLEPRAPATRPAATPTPAP